MKKDMATSTGQEYNQHSPKVSFEWWSEAWKYFRQKPGLWMTITFYAGVILSPFLALAYYNTENVASPGCGGWILPLLGITFTVQFILTAGMCRIALRQVRGETVSVQEFFSVMEVFQRLINYAIPYSIIAIAVPFPRYISVYNNGSVHGWSDWWQGGTALPIVACLFLYLAYVILSGTFMFAPVAAADKKTDRNDSLRFSLQLLKKQWGMAASYYASGCIVASLGVLGLGVGLLITIPVFIISLAIGYVKFTENTVVEHLHDQEPKAETTKLVEIPKPRGNLQRSTPAALIFDEIVSIEDNRDHIRRLIEQLQSGSLIPFIGAGLSKPYGFALWSDFLLLQADRARMRPAIALRLKAGEYEEAAQDLLAARGNSAFDDAIEAEFGLHKLKDTKFSGAVTHIARLATGPVITTNFDRVLETAFAQANVQFTETVWGAKVGIATDALNRNERILLKLHGDVRDYTDRVLTKPDYDMHYGGSDGSALDLSRPLPKLLRQMLIGRPLLFIGCSLNADRTLQVLSSVAVDFRGTRHYAILEMPGSDDEFIARGRFLADHNIRPIWYPYGRHDYVTSILAYLADQIPSH